MTDSALISFSTCDFCDACKDEDVPVLRVLPPVFGSWGAKSSFAGPVSTLKCFEDNSLVKQMLDQPGGGRVLVVDGGGSLRRALVGGNIAAAAAANGWAGIVVHGAVRDVAELDAANVGIRALALVPMPTQKRGEGQSDISLEFCGVRVQSGDWLYADADGIVISPHPLHAPA